jgi:hypothetical protein
LSSGSQAELEQLTSAMMVLPFGIATTSPLAGCSEFADFMHLKGF